MELVVEAILNGDVQLRDDQPIGQYLVEHAAEYHFDLPLSEGENKFLNRVYTYFRSKESDIVRSQNETESAQRRGEQNVEQAERVIKNINGILTGTVQVEQKAGESIEDAIRRKFPDEGEDAVLFYFSALYRRVQIETIPSQQARIREEAGHTGRTDMIPVVQAIFTGNVKLVGDQTVAEYLKDHASEYPFDPPLSDTEGESLGKVYTLWKKVEGDLSAIKESALEKEGVLRTERDEALEARRVAVDAKTDADIENLKLGLQLKTSTEYAQELGVAIIELRAELETSKSSFQRANAELLDQVTEKQGEADRQIQENAHLRSEFAKREEVIAQLQETATQVSGLNRELEAVRASANEFTVLLQELEAAREGLKRLRELEAQVTVAELFNKDHIQVFVTRMSDALTRADFAKEVPFVRSTLEDTLRSLAGKIDPSVLEGKTPVPDMKGLADQLRAGQYPIKEQRAKYMLFKSALTRVLTASVISAEVPHLVPVLVDSLFADEQALRDILDIILLKQ